MNINELTLGQIKEIKSLFGGVSCEPSSMNSYPYSIGEKYLIRTVTHYYIGVLKNVFEEELLLSSASWIPDTGRFYDALKTGKLDEVEPIIGDVIVGRGAVIDAIMWGHDVPKDQK